MKFYNVKTFALIAIIFCGFSLIFGLSSRLEEARPALPAGYADEDLALQGAKLKGFCLGFEGLIADWYWVKSLQYIGDKLVGSQQEQISLDNLQSLDPRLLYPYLDNSTTLDPHFIEVYSYGAIVLPAYNVKQAVAIAEKGIANNPNEWRLYQHLGYIYWKSKDYEKAAEVYAAGAKIKDAPAFLGLMAARMKSEGGSSDLARAMYQQIYQSATDEQTKDLAIRRLQQLDSDERRDQIQAALQKFQLANNRCAANWREVFPLLQNLRTQSGDKLSFAATLEPLDPSETAYVLKNQNGSCAVELDSSRSKILAK